MARSLPPSMAGPLKNNFFVQVPEDEKECSAKTDILSGTTNKKLDARQINSRSKEIIQKDKSQRKKNNTKENIILYINQPITYFFRVKTKDWKYELCIN